MCDPNYNRSKTLGDGAAERERESELQLGAPSARGGGDPSSGPVEEEERITMVHVCGCTWQANLAEMPGKSKFKLKPAPELR